MKEWLTAMGISLADGVDEETFARFLQHLSTNPLLQYRERLNWLLSTRNINLQLQSLQRYEEQFSSIAAPASLQTAVESLIVEFSVSCEATLTYSKNLVLCGARLRYLIRNSGAGRECHS